MKYNLTAIASVDLDIAEAPYLGGEFAVYLSRTQSVNLGSITMTASGSGSVGSYATWAGNPGAVIKAGGADLQLVATGELQSPNGPCTVVFNVINELAAATTLTFTFNTPARAADASASFPRGVATDGVLAAGSKVVSITSLQSITNGNRGSLFALYQLPEAADYVLVGCTTEKKFTTKSREPVGIDDGMERDRFVKKGKTKRGTLTIDSKFGGMTDRLTRFDGARCTAMLLGIKDGQVTTDRLVFAGYIPGVDVDLPDGEGEAKENAAGGLYEEGLFFVAL